jgi:phospholipase/carboxylesterase
MQSNTELEFITRKTAATPATASIIWLHGLGADCHDFAPIISELNIPSNLSVKFIFPNAPIRNITINGGFPCRAWYDIYNLTELRQEDTTGIQASEAAITKLITAEVDNGISTDRIILAGFSQGGAMALYTGLRYAQPLAGIIALSCYLPMSATAKESFENHKNLSILQMHGTNDDVIPVIAGEKTNQFLNDIKQQTQLVKLPIGHEVSIPQLQQIGQWITRTLI